jgi:hypothetical protein
VNVNATGEETIFPTVVESGDLPDGWKSQKMRIEFPKAIPYSVLSWVDGVQQPTQVVNCGTTITHDANAEKALMLSLKRRSDPDFDCLAEVTLGYDNTRATGKPTPIPTMKMPDVAPPPPPDPNAPPDPFSGPLAVIGEDELRSVAELRKIATEVKEGTDFRGEHKHVAFLVWEAGLHEQGQLGQGDNGEIVRAVKLMIRLGYVVYFAYNIEAAPFLRIFTSLLDATKEHFLFFFSGHGGNVPDQDGDEAGGDDSTLAFENGWVRDDSMLDMLRTHGRQSCKYLLMSESCHGGSVFDIQSALRWKQKIPDHVVSYCATADDAISFGFLHALWNALEANPLITPRQLKPIVDAGLTSVTQLAASSERVLDRVFLEKVADVPEHPRAYDGGWRDRSRFPEISSGAIQSQGRKAAPPTVALPRLPAEPELTPVEIDFAPATVSRVSPKKNDARFIPITPVEIRTRVNGPGLIRFAVSKHRAVEIGVQIQPPGKEATWKAHEFVKLSIPRDDSRVEVVILLKFEVEGRHVVMIWLNNDRGSLSQQCEYHFEVAKPCDPKLTVVQFVPPGREIVPIASEVMKVDPGGMGIIVPKRFLVSTYEFKGEKLLVNINWDEPRTLWPHTLETKTLSGGWKRSKVSFDFPEPVAYRILTWVDDLRQPNQIVSCGPPAVHDADAEAELMAALAAALQAG